MRKYYVHIPIVGSITTEVDAESEKDAIEMAWTRYNEAGSDGFDVEWEATDKIVTGNVLHAPLNECIAWEKK